MEANQLNELPFEEAIDFQEGPGILAKDFHDQGVPLIRLAGLKSGNSLLEGCNYLSPDKVSKKWSHFRLQAGDVLLSTSATLGRVAIVDERSAGAIAYTGLIRMRPRHSDVNPDFIPFLLQSSHFQQQCDAMGAGSVLKHFGPTHLRQMTVRLPSAEEQKAIAHILGTLDDKIELNRQMNATLEAMAQALFKSWFVDFDPVIDNALASRNPIPEPLQARADARAALTPSPSPQGRGEPGSPSLRGKGAQESPLPLGEGLGEGEGIQRKPLPEAIQKQFPDRFVFNDDMGWVPEGWPETAVKEIAKVVKGKSYKSAELSESETALVTLKSFNRGGGYRLDGLKEYTGAYKPEQEVFPGELVIAYTDVTQAADVIGKPAIVASDERYKSLVISLDVAVVRPEIQSHKL